MHYEIKGDSYPVVVCNLENGEQMITERGSMVWMSPNMKMETNLGNPGKIFTKVFTGEQLFHNIYTAQGRGMVAFGSSFPGQIIPLSIAPGQEMVVQRSSFLASTMGVNLSIHFHRKFGALFGGEGLVMQRLGGNGTAFIEIDGDLVKYDLKEGQQLVVSTGNVAAFTLSVKMDVTWVPGVKNVLFGGEGLLNTTLTGPGTVWLQTMPIHSMAAAMRPYIAGNK